MVDSLWLLWYKQHQQVRVIFYMKHLAIFVVSALCVGSLSSYAKDSKAYTQILRSVPAAELPAKSADLVKKANVREWGNTTVGVVQAGVKISPVSAPAIVGAIAKAVPDMASIAASTAVIEQPKQAAAIARAAATAAPSKAGKIVAAIVRVLPSESKAVAVSVAAALPGSGRDVLSGVASAQPQLRQQLAGSSALTAPEVALALDQAYQSAIAAGPLPQGPSIGAPYLPPSGAPSNVTTNNSGPVPPGGRDYAAPL